MNNREFAETVLTQEGEELRRWEAEEPFVGAVVELPRGGFAVRVGQPSVYTGRKKSNLPVAITLDIYRRYPKASQRLNKFFDEDLA